VKTELCSAFRSFLQMTQSSFCAVSLGMWFESRKEGERSTGCKDGVLAQYFLWVIFSTGLLSFHRTLRLMAWWLSGYSARLEILFLRERRFESGPRRLLFFVYCFFKFQYFMSSLIYTYRLIFLSTMTPCQDSSGVLCGYRGSRVENSRYGECETRSQHSNPIPALPYLSNKP
jgi:hypothetical protein